MVNPAPDVVLAARCFDGTQRVFRHRSDMTGTDMRFAAFPHLTHYSPPAGGRLFGGSRRQLLRALPSRAPRSFRRKKQT